MCSWNETIKCVLLFLFRVRFFLDIGNADFVSNLLLINLHFCCEAKGM